MSKRRIFGNENGEIILEARPMESGGMGMALILKRPNEVVTVALSPKNAVKIGEAMVQMGHGIISETSDSSPAARRSPEQTAREICDEMAVRMRAMGINTSAHYDAGLQLIADALALATPEPTQ